MTHATNCRLMIRAASRTKLVCTSTGIVQRFCTPHFPKGSSHHQTDLQTSLMKSRQLFILCLSTRFATATSWPFRTRGGIGKDDEEEENVLVDAMFDNGQLSSMHTATTVQQQRHGDDEGDRQAGLAILSSYYKDPEQYSQALLEHVRESAGNLHELLVTTRRRLHQYPELMYQEKETSELVQAILQQHNISYTTGWAVNIHPDAHPGPGGYGIVADIGTGQAPCVLIRGDMDALPIFERTEGIESFRSRCDKKMHACGHDGHTTMLLGAAILLKQMEDSIPGTIRVMFQPAEEGGAGAKRMREEGVLTKEPKPSYAFGMHLWPTLPSGTVAGRPGSLLAGSERFEILVAGVGGHAAMPHLTVDPIVTASAMVMNLQTIVSRAISPLESGVCSITKIEAGEAFNIIPHSAVIRGTVRALSTETLLSLRDRVKHIVESTAAVYGCNATVEFSRDYYPPTVNDPDLFENFSKHVGGLVSAEGYTRETEPIMVAEDFSFLAETIPSTFFLMGQGSATDPPSNYGLHHPHFAIDESVLPRGVELHVNLALRALKQLQQDQNAPS